MQHQDVFPALEHFTQLKGADVADSSPTADRPPVTRRRVPAIPVMMIGLVVTAVLLAIVDAARTDSSSRVTNDGISVPAFGRPGTGQPVSGTTELCTAFDDAGKYFDEQNTVNFAAGLTAISYYVHVARRYPAESIQWGARNIGTAVSTGSVSIETWYSNTRDVRTVCR